MWPSDRVCMIVCESERPVERHMRLLKSGGRQPPDRTMESWIGSRGMQGWCCTGLAVVGAGVPEDEGGILRALTAMLWGGKVWSWSSSRAHEAHCVLARADSQDMYRYRTQLGRLT